MVMKYIVMDLLKLVSRQQLSKNVPTRNSGNCVSVEECYSKLLGSSQHSNELGVAIT
jgi:hypothetical protein